MLEHLNQLPQQPARAVIIGAGGFVGSAIARQLAQEQVPVLAITRKEIDLLQPEAGKALTEAVGAATMRSFSSRRWRLRGIP